jgi:hypothetical protein
MLRRSRDALLVGMTVELYVILPTGKLIWYMMSYQNDISSEGLRGGDQHIIFRQLAKRRHRVRTLAE